MTTQPPPPPRNPATANPPPPQPLPPPVPTAPTIPTPAPWYNSWRPAILIAAGVAVLLVLLVLVLRRSRFAPPSATAAQVWWVIIVIALVGLTWLAWRVLAGTVIGTVLAAIIAVVLLMPFFIGLIASLVRSPGKEADLSPPPGPTVVVTPAAPASTVTVTPPQATVTVTPTGPTATADEPAPFPPSATVPPVPTDEPPTAAPVPVSITPPTGAVSRIFALSGTGDVPEGRQLLVFVHAPGTGLYYTDGSASARSGHRWVAPQVYLGSSSACDNGRTYTVYVVTADDAAAAANSAFHAANPDAGYTPADWNAKFGGFTRDSVSVTRAGKAANC